MRIWTPEQRQEQANRIRERQIWLKSTGPRTSEGKEISKINAWKHGQYCRQAYTLHAALRNKILYVKVLFEKQKELLRFQRNELRASGQKNPFSSFINAQNREFTAGLSTGLRW